MEIRQNLEKNADYDFPPPTQKIVGAENEIFDFTLEWIFLSFSLRFS